MTWLQRLLVEGLGIGTEVVPVPSSTWKDEGLEALCRDLSPVDALDLRAERAAILEHMAELPRHEAERRAGLSAACAMEATG